MKKTKWMIIMGIVLSISLLLAACGSQDSGSQSTGTQDSSSENSGAPATESNSSEQDGEAINWIFGHLANEDHVWHKTALKFAELVNEKTNGQIEITIYPNNQLGGETDTINSIRAGTADLVISGETMANWAPKAALMAVPYAFRDAEHLKKTVEGEIGREIEEDIIDKVGLTPLYYHTRAPRNLTSNREITAPSDLNGFKMRVPNVPLFLSAWEAAGAKPQVMDFNEVFTGLQQNVIDGQENPVDLIQSGNLNEVQKFVNKTEHVYSWIYILVGNKQFEALTDAQREAVLEAAKEAQAFGAELFEVEIDEITNDLVSRGMSFVDVDQDAFREAMLPAIQNSLTAEQFELYEKILHVQ